MVAAVKGYVAAIGFDVIARGGGVICDFGKPQQGWVGPGVDQQVGRRDERRTGVDATGQ